MRENCTSSLGGGRRPAREHRARLLRPDSYEAGEQSERAHCGASTGANAAEPVERRAGAKGNAHQQTTHWTQSQARVSQALERIRHTACLCRHTPEVGAVCGKAACTVLCGGRAMNRTSLPPPGLDARFVLFAVRRT